MKRRLSGWHVSVGVRLLGYYVALAFYPLGVLRRFLLIAAGQNSMAPVMVGPFHAHGYYLGWKLLESELDLSHDPFRGGAIKLPAGHKVLMGKTAQGVGCPRGL